MNPLWLALIVGAPAPTPAPAPSPVPTPPPLVDCSAPSYTSLTYNLGFINGLRCAEVITASTYANTALPPPWIPAVLPGDGAYKKEADGILVSQSPGQMCLTDCSQTAVTLPTGGTSYTFAVSKSRSQSNGFNYGLLGPLFNYLAGPSWSGGATTSVLCSTNAVVNAPAMNIYSGQRRAFAVVMHTMKFYEKRSTSTVSGWREETFQYPNFHEGGVGNYNATYDFCAGTWSSATCPRLSACSETVVMPPIAP